eukprot:5212261-Prymnesium_polylepis.1
MITVSMSTSNARRVPPFVLSESGGMRELDASGFGRFVRRRSAACAGPEVPRRIRRGLGSLAAAGDACASAPPAALLDGLSMPVITTGGGSRGAGTLTNGVVASCGPVAGARFM